MLRRLSRYFLIKFKVIGLRLHSYDHFLSLSLHSFVSLVRQDHIMISSTQTPAPPSTIDNSILDEEKGAVKRPSVDWVGQEEKEENASTTSEDDGNIEGEYVTGSKLYLITLGLCVSVLLVGLVCIIFRTFSSYNR
jgi:hypothetical protein